MQVPDEDAPVHTPAPDIDPPAKTDVDVATTTLDGASRLPFVNQTEETWQSSVNRSLIRIDQAVLRLDNGELGTRDDRLVLTQNAQTKGAAG